MEKIDMSSNLPHVTNECVLCGRKWMCPLSDGVCDCGAMYKMSIKDDGNVAIFWTVTMRQYLIRLFECGHAKQSQEVKEIVKLIVKKQHDYQST